MSEAATDAGVEFAGVSYTLADGRMLLRNVSLALAAGTTTALLGRSGSGKTTLMRTVNALVRPTAGTVSVAGRAVADWPLLELRRSVGYVIQESGLFPHRTIASNIGMPLEVAGGRRDGDGYGRAVDDAMRMVGLDPAEFGKRYPWQLSGGQRQRAGVGRALVAGQAVLLMDEPFGALDPITRAEMQTMLRDLLGRVRKTVLLVTHDLDEALFLASRIVFLDAGQVVADLPAAEVLGSSNEAVRRYVAAVHRAVPA